MLHAAYKVIIKGSNEEVATDRLLMTWPDGRAPPLCLFPPVYGLMIYLCGIMLIDFTSDCYLRCTMGYDVPVL